MDERATTADPDLLLAYATRRSADAFAELVRRYAALVHGVGLRITGNTEDARDIAQECFLHLAAQAGQIAQPLPAWLHTFARSRAIDLKRRRSTRQRNERQASRCETVPLSPQEWETLSQQVDQAIEALDEDLRLPLIGLYLQGRTQEELAQSLGVSQGTISRRIERAVEQLRQHLRSAGVDVPAMSMGVALAHLRIQADLPAHLIANLTRMGLSGVGAKAAPAPRSASMLPRIAAGIGVFVVLSAGLAWWLAEGDRQNPALRTTTATENPNMAAAKTTPQVAPALRREDGKVWIDGLRPGRRDTSPYAQGLSILLQHLGHRDADYTRVMGYSGVAFALQMDLKGPINDGKYDVAWWPNDCYVFDLSIPLLSRAFGRELRRVYADPAAADYRREYQDRLEPAIIEAINQGRPVMGQQDAACLITGYDQPNHKPIAMWPTPGQPVFGAAHEGIPWGLFVPGSAIQSLPQDRAEIESLRWAVALWDESAAATSKDSGTTKLLTGSKAYARWLELLQDQAEGKGLGRDSWDNNLIIHLRYNRAAAVAYLRDLAQRQPATDAAHLRAAADLYQQVLDDTARAPFWGQFNNNPEVRPAKLREYTDMVRRVAQLEAQAISEIRQVLPGAPVNR